MPARPTNEPSNYFAFGKQSAKGTEASTFHFLKHLDGSAMELEEDITSEREGGDGQEVGLRYKTSITMDGEFNAYSRPEVAAKLWAYTLGAASVYSPIGLATVASGVTQQHVAVPNATMPYLTVEQYFADQIERVSDAMVKGLTIEGSHDKPLSIKGDFVGGGTPYRRDVASVLTATRETADPWMFVRGSYVLDGSGNTKLTKFKMDVKRNVDDGIYTTELFRTDVIPLNFDVDLEFTLLYEDKTLYDKIKYGSGSMTLPNLATGSFQVHQLIGSGTNYREMSIWVNNIQYTGARVNKLDSDGKTMYLDVTAMGLKTATHQIAARHQAASQGVLI